MCEQASFIATYDKDTDEISVYYDLYKDSHSEMFKELGINSKQEDDCVRIEFIPPNGDICEKDFTKWKFNVDQNVQPDWWPLCAAYVENLVRTDGIEQYLETRILAQSGIGADNSTATLGNESTATLGNESTATLGNGSKATLGDRSKATLGNESTATLGNKSTATLGYGSTATLGYGSKATLGDRSKATLGNESTATLGNESTATLGYGSKATLGYGSKATLGYGSKATLGYGSTATLGYGSTATLGYGSKATLGYGSKATLGDRSTAKAGELSEITFQWYDGKRTRIAVAYVGEDGILPNVFYKCVNGKIVPAEVTE